MSRHCLPEATKEVHECITRITILCILITLVGAESVRNPTTTEGRYSPFSRFINVMTAHFPSPTETALCRVFHFGERGELRFNFNVPDCGQPEDPARRRAGRMGFSGRERNVRG